MVDNFIDRKHGREVISYPDPQYQHESLQPILEPTYGIILYQEQVMQIAQVLAGYTLAEADLLRRAMGKKKPEEMAKQRDVFARGAAERGVDATLASKLFDLVEKFAGYGFNKSHSAAYALVSYQTPG
jgi:DNA polymerase-3 subunit alpha